MRINDVVCRYYVKLMGSAEEDLRARLAALTTDGDEDMPADESDVRVRVHRDTFIVLKVLTLSQLGASARVSTPQ